MGNSKLTNLAKTRAQFGDYSECLQLIFENMPPEGKCIRLNSRIICSEITDINNKFLIRENSYGLSEKIHFVTIDGIKWLACEAEFLFYIFNEDMSMTYYLTID